MITETMESILEALREIDRVTVTPYLGEISDPERPDLNQHQLPIIFVDYVGDESDGETRKLFFNLYVVHVTYSNAPAYRHGAHDEVFTLLEEIDTRLRHVETAHLLPRRSRKIFDDRTPKGYLSIYSRSVEAQITDEGVSEWNLE